MKCGSAALPDGASAAGKIADPAVVGRALRGLLARTEIAQTRALVAASDSVGTFRIVTLPATATRKDIDATLAKELPFDPERMATRWIDVSPDQGERLIYAVTWDRALVKNVAESVKLGGIDPQVLELKSASVARVVSTPSCLLVDLVPSPAEIVLIHDHVPQLWHSFNVDDAASSTSALALGVALRTVLRYFRRATGGQSLDDIPIFISTEQDLPQTALDEVTARVGQPVRPLPVPERVAPNVRHSTYLACLGLLMRRSS